MTTTVPPPPSVLDNQSCELIRWSRTRGRRYENADLKPSPIAVMWSFGELGVPHTAHVSPLTLNGAQNYDAHCQEPLCCFIVRSNSRSSINPHRVRVE
ncbi:hypothetical protein TNCV_3772531 [Trichonephila clavipes]|nr:hypothetical protein TNCV_3772531 [Trichonephila clavipes]